MLQIIESEEELASIEERKVKTKEKIESPNVSVREELPDEVKWKPENDD